VQALVSRMVLSARLEGPFVCAQQNRCYAHPRTPGKLGNTNGPETEHCSCNLKHLSLAHYPAGPTSNNSRYDLRVHKGSSERLHAFVTETSERSRAFARETKAPPNAVSQQRDNHKSLRRFRRREHGVDWAPYAENAKPEPVSDAEGEIWRGESLVIPSKFT
jgi:hypothetical protein